jgi:hypothetical protein
LVIARSELSVIVVVSVAELLVVGESVTPAGAVTVAVFDSVPVAEEATVPVAVNGRALGRGQADRGRDVARAGGRGAAAAHGRAGPGDAGERRREGVTHRGVHDVGWAVVS